MYKIPNTDLIAMDESEYLEHFGIPGMKWGHRKASGSKAQNGITKYQVKSAKSRMKEAHKNRSHAPRDTSSYKETLSDYKKASGDYYNTKRQFKGKSIRSNVSASRIQLFKNVGASFLKRASIATFLLTSTVALTLTPQDRNVLKVGAQYLAAQGVKSAAVDLGRAAGKVARSGAGKAATSAVKSVANNKVVNAARRAKKYGKYINTTGFSVPSASRLIES